MSARGVGREPEELVRRRLSRASEKFLRRLQGEAMRRKPHDPAARVGSAAALRHKLFSPEDWNRRARLEPGLIAAVAALDQGLTAPRRRTKKLAKPHDLRRESMRVPK
jgi:hypothetical protein